MSDLRVLPAVTLMQLTPLTPRQRDVVVMISDGLQKQFALGTTFAYIAR